MPDCTYDQHSKTDLLHIERSMRFSYGQVANQQATLKANCEVYPNESFGAYTVSHNTHFRKFYAPAEPLDKRRVMLPKLLRGRPCVILAIHEGTANRTQTTLATLIVSNVRFSRCGAMCSGPHSGPTSRSSMPGIA